MDNPSNLLKTGLEALGLDISTEIQTKLIQYQENLLDTNQRLNLTAIKDPQQAVVKHLLDSLSALMLDALEPQGHENWLDIGSGGGLPGMPIAIARPEISMGLVEATQKKAAFLEQCARELTLDNRLHVYSQRSETLARGELREKVPVCLARGLGQLRVILELAIPFLQVGGVLIAYKGPRADEELKDAAKAMTILNTTLVDRRDFMLPFLEEKRSLLVLKKNAPVSKDYPRAPGNPSKEPL